MSHVSRRDTLKLLAVPLLGAACKTTSEQKTSAATPAVKSSPILNVRELGFPWKTPDPFLACMHHEDHYPAGNPFFGPEASLDGRNLGSDFGGKDGWSMYHGHIVPGFPQHPHRGFETVSVVRQGLLDHSDSLGAVARYGRGDVQWLTAGRGILHAEMFPLLDRSSHNPLELFQIWLNLPKSHKMVDPHFTMLWANTVPKHTFRDERGRTTSVTTIAGALGGSTPPSPPPKSWASQPDTDFAIWTIALAPGARWTIPAAAAGSNRSLYFHVGKAMRIADRDVAENRQIDVAPDREITLVNGPEASEILMLQGKPIGEPIARQGPFVMNTHAEIRQAYADYQATQFGGWPWPAPDPVHGPEDERFARFSDGTVDRPV